jgi:hypothetical protein
MSDTLSHDRKRVYPQNQKPRAETRCQGGLCPRTWERESWDGTLYYGEKLTIVRNQKDELKTGTLHAMLTQLGLTLREL